MRFLFIDDLIGNYNFATVYSYTSLLCQLEVGNIAAHNKREAVEGKMGKCYNSQLKANHFHSITLKLLLLVNFVVFICN